MRAEFLTVFAVGALLAGCAGVDHGPDVYWVREGDLLKLLRPLGFNDRSIQEVRQNPSGTMLFITDFSEDGTVAEDTYAIAANPERTRVYKNCKWNWFNEDGTPFGKCSGDMTCRLVDGSPFPANEVKYNVIGVDDHVHYFLAHSFANRETSIFHVDDPTTPVLSFIDPDFLPLNVWSTRQSCISSDSRLLRVMRTIGVKMSLGRSR